MKSKYYSKSKNSGYKLFKENDFPKFLSSVKSAIEINHIGCDCSYCKECTPNYIADRNWKKFRKTQWKSLS